MPRPRHDPIKETTMRAILSQAGIEKEDFLDRRVLVQKQSNWPLLNYMVFV
jgi:hypothetical protein